MVKHRIMITVEGLHYYIDITGISMTWCIKEIEYILNLNDIEFTIECASRLIEVKENEKTEIETIIEKIKKRRLTCH